MKVKVKNEQEQPDKPEEKEVAELPDEKEQDPEKDEAEERARALELENARLKGILEGSKKTEPAAPAQGQYAHVWTDINSMSEEDFETKYRVKKHQASAAILDDEMKRSGAQTKREIAELKAQNQLMAKYGADFARHQEAVEEALADAAPEVRQDPARLAKFMERTFLSIPKGEKEEVRTRPKAEAPVERKRIVENFEKPTPKADDEKSKGDDVPDEFRAVAGKFGIHSEAERKKLMSSDYVPMDLGGGVVFEDPAKGFEKRERVA